MSSIEKTTLGDKTTLKITMGKDYADASAPVIAEIAETHGAEFRTTSSRQGEMISFYVINTAKEAAFTAAVSGALNIQLQPTF